MKQCLIMPNQFLLSIPKPTLYMYIACILHVYHDLFSKIIIIIPPIHAHVVSSE